MIVNTHLEGWEVITQRAHALLAAELIAPWRAEQRPPSWIAILAALIQHDDEENYWEHTEHLTELGTPINFDKIRIDRALRKERTVISNALHQDLIVALLISRHNTYIYNDLHDEEDQIKLFLDEQAANQKRWLKMAKIKRVDLEAWYAFMGFGDRLSLILCQRQLPDKERRLEIMPNGPLGNRYEVFQRSDESVGIVPYPYDNDEVTVRVNTRLLRQTTFDDTWAFRRLVESSSVTSCEWTIRR
jgi:hypothetical protein